MRFARPALRLALLALLVGILLGLLVPRLFAGTSPSGEVRVHVVSNGDTLWSLAVELSPGSDPREFIHEVKALNGIEGGRIFPGQRIVLPPAD